MLTCFISCAISTQLVVILFSCKWFIETWNLGLLQRFDESTPARLQFHSKCEDDSSRVPHSVGHRASGSYASAGQGSSHHEAGQKLIGPTLVRIGLMSISCIFGCMHRAKVSSKCNDLIPVPILIVRLSINQALLACTTPSCARTTHRSYRVRDYIHTYVLAE